MALNLHISYVSLVGSGVLAVGVGLLLEVPVSYTHLVVRRVPEMEF